MPGTSIIYTEFENTIRSAIDAVKPSALMAANIKLQGNSLTVCSKVYDLNHYGNIYIVGAGKSSAYMAKEIESILGDKITGGVVSVKYGHTANCSKVKIIEAGHPEPDANSLLAAEKILQIARNASENDLVIVLISGGGSSLMEKPAGDISIEELREVYDALIKSGAGITEINSVRKQLSLVKGGGLARAIYPATCIGLIISDVISDDPSAVASGPTSPDNSSIDDVYKVIKKYDIETKIPSIIKTSVTGVKNDETNKDIFNRVENFIIGNNKIALEAAAGEAKKYEYNTMLITSEFDGTVEEAAEFVSSMIKGITENGYPTGKPACILIGGEPVISVKGSGKGGRNQHLALSVSDRLKGVEGNWLFASIGTDGTDGPTDAAGAWITPETCKTAEKVGLNAKDSLANFDSYSFFEQTGGLYKTGPTGVNVMDIMIALIR